MLIATLCRYQASARNHGTVADNGNGTFTITPAANYNGSVGLGYTVIDGHGGSVAASESFSLAAVNDAPVLTGIQTTLAAGTEDTAYTVSAANLLAGFTDVDGDTVSISGLSANHGTVATTATGPSPSRLRPTTTAPSVLGYTVIDGHGGSVAASQTFNLAAINDAPFDIDLRANNAIATDMNARAQRSARSLHLIPTAPLSRFRSSATSLPASPSPEAHSISRAARI
jgi:hypothetical protein